MEKTKLVLVVFVIVVGAAVVFFAANPTGQVTEQTTFQQEEKSYIEIASILDSVMTVRNSGNAPVVTEDVLIMIDNYRVPCEWSSDTIAPRTAEQCLLPLRCAGSVVMVVYENSDSGFCA